jgi:parvulin-like peptidyl-prolyl isomerase
MKPTRLVIAVLVALAVLVAAACGGKDEQSVPADAVAVVDGTAITRADLNALIARAKKSYTIQKRNFPKAGTAEYQALQTQAVAFLVNRVEYDKRAGELEITVTNKEIDDRIAAVKKQSFNGSQAKLEKALKAQGSTTADLRDDIKTGLLQEKLYAAITKDVKVTDAQIAAYYKQNKSQYVIQDSRDVRHILVKTKAQANKIYAQLAAGGSWKVLAKKYSIDPGSKDKGGEMTILRGQTVPPFDTTAFLLKTNRVSRPVKTTYGYHVIEPISAIKRGKTTPLKDVKASIKAQLLEKAKADSTTKWTSDTTKAFEGKVAYAAGFAPPATATDTATTSG